MNQKILTVVCLVLAFALGGAVTWIFKSEPEHFVMDMDAFDELFDDRFLSGSRSPFEEMDRIRERMDRMFGDQRSGFDSWFKDEFGEFPISQIETRESDDMIFYELDVGDQEVRNVQVETEGGYLSIHAELVEGSATSRKQTTISQRFPVPPNAVPGSVSTDHRDGKLIVSFKKRVV